MNIQRNECCNFILKGIHLRCFVKVKSMNLNKTQLIAVAAVAIIAIAAVAWFVTSDSGPHKGNAEFGVAEFRLDVYGNANEDLVIDQKDVDLIKKIMNGDETGSHPLADANLDNKVDQKDVDLVNKIIAGQDCTVNIICLNPAGEEIDMPVSFPVKHAVPYGSNISVPFINAGAVEHCAGYMYKKTSYPGMNAILFNSDAVEIPISRQMTTAGWQQFIDLDAYLIESTGKGIDAFFVDHSLTTLDKSPVYRQDLEAAGIPEIRLATADPVEEINGTLLMGFLVNEEQGYKYASKSIECYNDILDKLSVLDVEDQTTYICITMSTYVCQNDSTFNTVPAYVGGTPYYTVNAEFAALYKGTSSLPMNDPEALSNFDDVGAIICSNNLDFVTSDVNGTIIAEWEDGADHYKNLDCYEGRVLLNSICPGAVKLAAVAAVLYPDLISQDMLQDIYDEVASVAPSINGHSFEEARAIITYQDYVAAQNA